MKFQFYLSVLFVLTLFSITVPQVNAAPTDLQVVDVVQTKKLVRGRTAYYSYTINVFNPEVSLANVTAVVTSQSRTIRVTKRNLSIGDIASGNTQTSTNSFTIGIDARRAPDLNQLEYTFSGEEVASSDTTAPTIVASLSLPPNQAGWHNQAVTVSFECTDDVEVASCSPGILVETQGEGQVVQGTAVDTSGNQTSTEVIINLDSIAPQISASMFSGSDTPPVDGVTLLQKATIEVLAEPETELLAYQQGSENELIAQTTIGADGRTLLMDIPLEVGEANFLLTATDVAGNEAEFSLSLFRNQCLATPINAPFYLQQMPSEPLIALQPDSEQFAGQYHQFLFTAQDLIQVVPGFINDDVHTDWIILDGEQSGVKVLFGQTAIEQTVQTGGIPTFALLGNFVDTEAVDLAVGHKDGTLRLFAGKGDGSFSSNAVQEFAHNGEVKALQSADLNGDGIVDILLLTDSELWLYQKATYSSTVPVIDNSRFTNGLVGWQVSAVGQKAGELAGQVTQAGAGAQLTENDSFLVTLSQRFTPSASHGELSFDIFSSALDVPLNSIQDAIEVSLLTDNNQSGVPTFRPEATSFLNITADGQVRTAPGVTYNNGRVQLDTSGITQPVTLYFDLIGNPPDRGSTYVVGNVDAGTVTVIDNSFDPSNISNDLTNRGGVLCDNETANPPIIIDSGDNILIFSKDDSGHYVLQSSLVQGGATL